MDYEKSPDRNINVTNKKYQNNLSVSRDVIKKQRNDIDAPKTSRGDLLRMIDLGGMPITLQYQGKLNFTSALGGTISLFTLLIMAFYLVIALSYFLGRKDPVYSSTSEYHSIPKPIYMQRFKADHDLIAGIKIEQGKLHDDDSEIEINDKPILMDPTIVNYTITHVTTSSSFESKSDKILQHIQVNCKDSPSFLKTTKSGQTFYELNKLDMAVCFQMDSFNDENNNRQSIVLQGNEFSEVESFIEIKVKPCKNNTISNVTCKPLSSIRKFVKGARFSFFFNQRSFMIDDKAINPITNSTGNKIFNIQSYFNKKMELLVRNNTVMNQYDYITMAKPQHILTFSDTNLDIDFVSEADFGNANLLEFKISPDSVSYIYSRKFQMLKEFFVGIVGILNGLFLVGTGLAKFMNRFLMQISLINKSFYLESDEVEEEHPANVVELKSKYAIDPLKSSSEKKKRESKIISKNDKKSNKEKDKNKDKDKDINNKENENSEKGKNKYKNKAKDKDKDKDKENDKSSLRDLMHDENEKIKQLSSSINEVNDNDNENENKKENENENKKKEDNSNDSKNNDKKDGDSENDSEDDSEQVSSGDLDPVSPNLSITKSLPNPWLNMKNLLIPIKSKRYDQFSMDAIELVKQMLPCYKNNKRLMNKKKILNDCSQQISAFFDIERIISILREYEDLRTTILNEEEYKILKQLTTPIINIREGEVFIKKTEKIAVSQDELKSMYLHFACSINKLIRSPYISPIEYNLIDLHRIGIEYQDEMLIKKKSRKLIKNKKTGISN
jgi:hypothetical protein